jgi:hypothetical protein
MRYRPANTIPGVNPPTGNESEEIRRPTGEAIAAAATGAAGDSNSAVVACESEPAGTPQEGQNLLDDDNSPPQDGQIIVLFRFRFSKIH